MNCLPHGFSSSIPGVVLSRATLLISLLCGLTCVRAQQAHDKWERVYTGEESVIEINVSNMKLEPNHTLRAQFRTILSQPEALKGTPEAKYKTRLETIDFKLNERRYRLFEISLLDASGKVLQSYSANALGDWRVLKAGGITERLFNAARALPPFGSWKILTYRFAEGNPGVAERTLNLERLIGTRVRIYSDRAEVGAKVCTSPSFQDKRSTQKEFLQELGVELKSIGIRTDFADTINVRCEGSGWQPPRSLLIKVSEGEMLMLWEGVFFVLKRESHG